MWRSFELWQCPEITLDHGRSRCRVATPVIGEQRQIVVIQR
jgi:hypothetical protein